MDLQHDDLTGRGQKVGGGAYLVGGRGSLGLCLWDPTWPWPLPVFPFPLLPACHDVSSLHYMIPPSGCLTTGPESCSQELWNETSKAIAKVKSSSLKFVRYLVTVIKKSLNNKPKFNRN
jgi:hypothetical protein